MENLIKLLNLLEKVSYNCPLLIVGWRNSAEYSTSMDTNNDAECVFVGNSFLDEDDATLLREGKNLKNELQVLPRR